MSRQLTVAMCLLCARATAQPTLTAVRPSLLMVEDGVVGSAFVAAGTAPALVRIRTTIQADGRVEELLTLSPSAAFELGVPDFPEQTWAIDLENSVAPNDKGTLSAAAVAAAIERAPPPYKAANWTVEAFVAEVDGKTVVPSHRVMALPTGAWIGVFVLAVPAGAKEIALRYRVYWEHDDQGAVYLAFDPSGRCTFAKRGASTTRVLVGDLPATQVVVNGKPVSACANDAAPFDFRFAGGEVLSQTAGTVPPAFVVRIPSADCKPAKGTFFACEGVLHEDPRLAEWSASLPPASYDTRSLWLARNWIFARQGRPFANKELRAWFGKQPWYRPDPEWSESRMDENARAAIEVLQRLEAASRPGAQGHGGAR